MNNSEILYLWNLKSSNGKLHENRIKMNIPPINENSSTNS